MNLTTQQMYSTMYAMVGTMMMVMFWQGLLMAVATPVAGAVGSYVSHKIFDDDRYE